MDRKIRVIIAPYAKYRIDGERNAKDYPRWAEVLDLLSSDCEMTQVIHGREGELRRSDGSEISYVRGLRIPEIERAVLKSDLFLCSDTYMQHMAHYVGRRGVVIFGPSDPGIFGYAENVNMFADRKYFRPFQFQTWRECDFNPDAFVTPRAVANAVTCLAAEIMADKIKS